MACLPISPPARSFDDTDRRPKVLWLPVQTQDCPATCTGAGLIAITLAPGDFSRAACAGFPSRSDDDDIYMGEQTIKFVYILVTKLAAACAGRRGVPVLLVVA